MRAVVLTTGARCELLDVPIPEPGPGEIRIRVEVAGICGTDQSIRHGGFPAARGRPLVMGHEFSGVVDAVGAGVLDFRPGDRVVADPNLHCGTCAWCRSGAYNHCESWGAVGLTVDGALAEQLCVPASNALHLPPGLSFRLGALIEPLSCVLHAFDHARVRNGARTLVVGGGMLGLTSLIVADEMGHEVHVIEPHAPRRRRAEHLGAREVAAPGQPLGVTEFEYVIEASGVAAAIPDAFSRLATRGTFMQLGATHPEHEFPIRPHDIFQRELRIVGSFSVADQYPAALDQAGRLAPQLESLVTHTFPLEEFEIAMETMRAPEAIKIHITSTRQET